MDKHLKFVPCTREIFRLTMNFWVWISIWWSRWIWQFSPLHIYKLNYTYYQQFKIYFKIKQIQLLISKHYYACMILSIFSLLISKSNKDKPALTEANSINKVKAIINQMRKRREIEL